MKTWIIKKLLAALNSRWLNDTPAHYGFINGLDALSYEQLQSEERQQPGITVKEVVEGIDRFRSCPVRKTGLTVIEGDHVRVGDLWDVHQLRQALTPNDQLTTNRVIFECKAVRTDGAVIYAAHIVGHNAHDALEEFVTTMSRNSSMYGRIFCDFGIHVRKVQSNCNQGKREEK